ncbi:hypothetical protein L1987_33989 [Smallanthus sonchifolius]|uniref:Uncharacterized protein n=1 Tax=Smallanthus sonchifolius TaxID=185202 RepID=A0ACB9HTA8_9ASTR|nr:hypothetical protein L1987_33989 [Smallanthus sonchifolius]
MDCDPGMQNSKVKICCSIGTAKMKDSQSIGKEKVFSKESRMKPFEVVSSDKEQNHNKKSKPLKSEKSDNSRHSDSVEIISFGPNFSPYKSQLEREFSEECQKGKQFITVTVAQI